jgi:hypothetical protein
MLGVVLAAISAAPVEAGPPPTSPIAGSPVPTLIVVRGVTYSAASEEVEEHGADRAPSSDGRSAGYGLEIDPASVAPSFPAAELHQNDLVRVRPQAVCSHGIAVTYDRITVSFGKTTRTLAIDSPMWRATATGTYLAAVSLHYTWASDVETGEGTATFRFKLHVPRTAR